MEEQQKEELCELIKEFNKIYKDEYKIVYVDKTNWCNAITRRKETVEDLFFMGVKNSSDRPRCILKIKYDDKEYKIHTYINHTNFSEGTWDRTYNIKDKYITIYYQTFCNPIVSHKVYSEPNIDKILKGQMMGQNGNSAFQHVENVVNDGYDKVIKRRENDEKLRCKTSILELLTRRHPYNLRAITVAELNDYPIPKNEDEVAVKLKQDSNYIIIKKSELEDEDIKKEISGYYPIITYEQCKDILDKIPKQEIDMTVIGLGSAGTGVLDQVIRGNWFNKYLLIDFDRVENKNLRNQWYIKNDISSTKTQASIRRMFDIKSPVIISENKKFQEVNLKFYKTKYVVSGFDNLRCRLQLLDKCLTDFEAEYLIDLRYLDYQSSIYFINLKDEKQVKYYRNLLLADMEAFGESVEEPVKEVEYITTQEEFVKWFDKKNGFVNRCSDLCSKYLGTPGTCRFNGHDYGCGDYDCKEYLYKKFLESGAKIEKIEETPPAPAEESSCIRENFIDIYKYSSAFIFAAIREIESENEKPFTHIEAQTDIIPSSVIVRK